MTDKKTQKTITIKVSTMDKLKALAKNENRNLSNFIEVELTKIANNGVKK